MTGNPLSSSRSSGTWNWCKTNESVSIKNANAVDRSHHRSDGSHGIHVLHDQRSKCECSREDLADSAFFIDATAAGHGWFIDSSIEDDDEFSVYAAEHELLADRQSPAFGQIDLLTVLTHELGHLLGHLMPSIAYALIYVGMGQILRRVLPMIEESKTLV